MVPATFLLRVIIGEEISSGPENTTGNRQMMSRSRAARGKIYWRTVQTRKGSAESPDRCRGQRKTVERNPRQDRS